MMNTSWLYQISVLLLVVIATAVSDDKEDKKRKLQIGVKKRVDCERKTRKSDSLKMHYTGKLENGVEFDSSHSRNEPFEFVLGAGQVIKGWDQGLLGMCVGDKRKLVIPPELGYGERGAPPKIPANAVLVFEVELLAINDKIDDEL